MKFLDMETDKTITLQQMKKDYETFKKEDPDNHSETFTTELFEIIMATINGRNDLQIVGMTAKEISNYIFKLRDVLKKQGIL